MTEMSDQELLEALGVEPESKKKTVLTPREERIISGFEEIQKFVKDNGRLPAHGEDKDIFERLYAMRLEQIRQQRECHSVVLELDHQGLLEAGGVATDVETEEMNDEMLLAQLGVNKTAESDVTELRYVQSRAEKRAAEEIASRTPCQDFDQFKPLFDAIQHDLDSGVRATRPYKDYAEIREGDFFILTGQKVYVSLVGEEFITEYDRRDSRLRVIYDNGTESDILLRSLQRALNKDPASRRILEVSAGPLFADGQEVEDLASGTIYVLRSKSDHPLVSENREIVHKIGVTGSSVEKRIANAQNEPTFLLADVEIAATYELFNINRQKLESLLHKFFEPARLEIQITDRFGKPVVPREWFLVPLFIVDDVVDKIRDGTIGEYRYARDTASVVRSQNQV